MWFHQRCMLIIELVCSSWKLIHKIFIIHSIEVFDTETFINLFIFKDLGGWVSSRTEVEVVDMVLRLRSKLNDADSIPASQHTRDKLQAHIQTLLSSLPEDLQSVLHASWVEDGLLPVYQKNKWKIIAGIS